MVPAAQSKKPNFLFIIADDLGFSDVGCFGSEIQTPNLDSLAGEGVRMLNYHTAAACSPTRSMVLSGTDAHMAGVGALIEYKRSELGQKRFNGKPGYEGFLNKDVAPISEILQDNGYFTALAGKWHLGLRTEYGPSSRGFDQSFACLPGCCNHFGWEPQLEGGGTGMPAGGRPIHAENGKVFKITPNAEEIPGGFYSSDYYTDRLIGYLRDRTKEEAEKPFFAYYAFSAPHWPIQCRKDFREKYKDSYHEGPDHLRRARLAKLVELGIISKDVIPHEVVAPDSAEWDDMTDEDRRRSSATMAAYAGMVEQIDHNIGRMIKYLKDAGEYDNTFIVFMSDNGAEGAALEAIPVMGTRIMDAIQKFYDNSPENIGAYNSYSWLGPRWAQASTAPSRLYKCFPSEGGILVPCIVKAPMFEASDNYKPGGFVRSFATCRDLAATAMDLCNITLPPAPGGKKVMHRGREVHPMRGKSWVPFFSASGNEARDVNGAASVYNDKDIIGWELHARAALRQGRWKIVHLPQKFGGAGKDGSLADNGEGWELFDVIADPGETRNLADREPEKLQEMLGYWEEYVKESQIVWGPGALDNGLPEDEFPLGYENTRALQQSWVSAKHGEVPEVSSKRASD